MSHLLIGQDMNLRYIPNVPAGNDIALSEGGMYVAAKRGVNEPLEIAAQVPECFDFQTWKFEVPNSSDRISILYVPQGDAAVSDVGGLGFSNASEAPGTPVTLGPPSEYDVERVAKIGDGIIVT
ncbi:hypothetical protein FRC07_008875 [Ceratobasidium sp. 392]|nr:hypothetical protein FRC07_008875 [Ceratobasidium sp. 392]